MPCLTFTLSPQGPCVDVVVGVSRPRYEALLAAQQPVPAPITLRGLLDTGAMCTAIDADVLMRLGLTQTGSIQCHTPSTQAGTPVEMRTFDVGLGLFHPQGSHGALVLNPISVTENRLAHQGIQALIGRDILCNCLFVFNGTHFSIAF